MNPINETIDKLVTAGVASIDTLHGCDEQTIARIEESLQFQMPDEYRYFLEKAGQKLGMFMEGSDFTCEKLSAINEDAVSLLEESASAYNLQKADFVFLMNQGYEFLFFTTNENKKIVKVSKFEEGEALPTQVASSFTEWFALACDDEIAAYEELKS